MLQKYLINRLLFDNNPVLIKEQCINSLQNKENCTVCQDMCFSKAWKDETLDVSLCLGCNTCVVACPCQCIRPSQKFMNRIMETLEQHNENWVISCESQNYPADLRLPCLRSLPWEAMAVLSLNGGLCFIRKDCDQCCQKGFLKVWEASLVKLQAFLGDDLFAKKIRVYFDGNSSSTQTYSRREAFSLFFSKMRNMTLNAVPVLNDNALDPDGSVYRQLLVYSLLQMRKNLNSFDDSVLPEVSSSPQAFFWQFPAFTDQCTACGICVKTCARKALHRVEAREQQDNIKIWYMVVIPWRCTNCGLCQRVCPKKGIENASYQKVSDPTKPHVITITAPACKHCGEPMPKESGSTCSLCQAETRDMASLLTWS